MMLIDRRRLRRRLRWVDWRADLLAAVVIALVVGSGWLLWG